MVFQDVYLSVSVFLSPFPPSLPSDPGSAPSLFGLFVKGNTLGFLDSSLILYGGSVTYFDYGSCSEKWECRYIIYSHLNLGKHVSSYDSFFLSGLITPRPSQSPVTGEVDRRDFRSARAGAGNTTSLDNTVSEANTPWTKRQTHRSPGQWPCTHWRNLEK